MGICIVHVESARNVHLAVLLHTEMSPRAWPDAPLQLGSVFHRSDSAINIELRERNNASVSHVSCAYPPAPLESGSLPRLKMPPRLDLVTGICLIGKGVGWYIAV